MRAFAERDPMAALRRLDALPRGRAYDSMLPAVASRFATANPDAALAWLDAQEAASTALRQAVYTGIAVADFARGYELSVGNSLPYALFDLSLPVAVLGDKAHAAEVADHLLAHGTSGSAQTLGSVVTSWARRDPDSVVDWMLAHGSEIDAPLAATIGHSVAARDVDGAIAYLDRLPPEVENVWIVQIADAYAENDAGAALEWVARYRGQAFFDDAYVQVVMRLADADPERAAGVISSSAPALQTAAAPRIARAWAARDPVAAALWTQSLRGSETESAAVNAVVNSWLGQDAEAARDWVVRLPRGNTRDQALSMLISRNLNARLDPRPILAEIDNEETLSRARQTAAIRAGSANLALAKELLETMVDDPRIGCWAREMIERVES
jgi:hypothetical protein